MLIAAFETFVDSRFDSEVLALEMYASRELAETAREMTEVGFFKRMFLHLQTSQYGSLSRGERELPSPPFTQRMSKMFRDIHSCEFGPEWAAEQARDHPNLEQLRSQALAHPLNRVEASLKEVVSGG